MHLLQLQSCDRKFSFNIGLIFHSYLTLWIIRLKFQLQLFNRNDKRTDLYIKMPFIIILINPIIGSNLMRKVRIRYYRHINLIRIANQSRASFIPLYPYQSICVIFRGKFQRMLTMPGNFRHCWHSLSEPAYVDIDWKIQRLSTYAVFTDWLRHIHTQ